MRGNSWSISSHPSTRSNQSLTSFLPTASAITTITVPATYTATAPSITTATTTVIATATARTHAQDADKKSSQVGALGPLVSLLGVLRDRQQKEVRAAAAMAVMAITSTDEGKRQVARCDHNHRFITDLLYEPDRSIRLCALKVVANIAVNPSLRATWATDRLALSALKQMAQAEGEDALVARHAKIALDAVCWKP